MMSLLLIAGIGLAALLLMIVVSCGIDNLKNARRNRNFMREEAGNLVLLVQLCRQGPTDKAATAAARELERRCVQAQRFAESILEFARNDDPFDSEAKAVTRAFVASARRDLEELGRLLSIRAESEGRFCLAFARWAEERLQEIAERLSPRSRHLAPA